MESQINLLPFTPDMVRRPTPAGSDATTTLRHFAIIPHVVLPARLRCLVDPHFDLDLQGIFCSPLQLTITTKNPNRLPPPKRTCYD